MPYPNFHAARVKAPRLFRKATMRTKSIDKGVSIIGGRLKRAPKDKENSFIVQTYRFDRDNFSVTDAKAWLKKEDVNYSSFEAAQAKVSGRVR